MEGIILQGIGSFYTVLGTDGARYVTRAQKKLRRQSAPLVGDRVTFTPGQGEEDGWLEAILVRRNQLIRPSVANVDTLMLVVAPQPLPDLLLIDRLMLRASRAGIGAALVVNKCDLGDALALQVTEEYRESDLAIYSVSAKTGEGLPALREALTGKTTCLAGQSAVGKSSLLNALFGMQLETGGLSRKTERGRHTTRRAELMPMGDALIMDTPGFSLLELEREMEAEELAERYEAYERLSEGCRFSPCLHDREPGCAVRRAVEAGTLSRPRWERYLRLLQEARENRKERYS